MIIFLLKQLKVAFRRYLSRPKLPYDLWNIGVKLKPGSQSRGNIKWQPAKTGGFIADPFPIEWHRRDYVFFEEYCGKRKSGQISVARLKADGNLETSKTSLKLPHHLSFPFVFRHEDDLFLMPEESQNQVLRIFRNKGALDQWDEFTCIFPKQAVVDSILHFYHGRWWLFTSRKSLGNSHSQNNLYLYFSPSLEGPWEAHPCNPVVVGLENSRMAGRIFESSGRLYRPAQNCLIRYGGSVRIFAIEELSPDSYLESFEKEVFPEVRGPFNQGIHTYNPFKGSIVLDGVAVAQT